MKINPEEFPIANQERFPNVTWQTPKEVGTVEGQPTYLLGIEDGGEKIVAILEEGADDFFAQPISELIGHTQGSIDLKFEE